jgi:hypothetical protein
MEHQHSLGRENCAYVTAKNRRLDVQDMTIDALNFFSLKLPTFWNLVTGLN